MVPEDLSDSYCIFLPLLFFVIAVSFRLLDPKKTIIKHIASHPDKVFTEKLKRALVYRSVHRFFIILMISSVVPAISCFLLG